MKHSVITYRSAGLEAKWSHTNRAFGFFFKATLPKAKPTQKLILKTSTLAFA